MKQTSITLALMFMLVASVGCAPGVELADSSVEGETGGNTVAGGTDGSTVDGSADGATVGGGINGNADGTGANGGDTNNGGAVGALDSDSDVPEAVFEDPENTASTVAPLDPDLPDLTLVANRRAGQTFLTWNELGSSSYHVYRHSEPITNDNLNSAIRLTGRWGALGQDTSINVHGTSDGPRNFVIGDLSAPLRDDQGLFVHTTQEGEQGVAYYAVTAVSGGAENRVIINGRNATSQPINEFVSTPRPVLALSANEGKGRLYTQYMDYANWNPTHNGYAFNFAVALPADYDPSIAYPLMVHLHAYATPHRFVSESEFGWQVIQLFPSDPGSSTNTVHTWWYGHAAEHNYNTEGFIPRSGAIENFTEQRVISAVNYLIEDAQFTVDRDLVHVYGSSMGGSGALSFGMRYPSLFAGIYANQPMTNYSTNRLFQNDFSRLWGEQSTNLPIVNRGPNSTDIQNYDMNGSQPTQVWNWMNHQEQLRRRRADRFAYLMIDHGKLDTVIDWQTQGQPMPQAFTDARVGFSAVALGERSHEWLAFVPVVKSVFGLGFGDEAEWRYPRSLSFPAIHNASGSGSIQPADNGDDRYNTNIEWSTPRNNFHQNIVDTVNNFEISIRSMGTTQTADITPRNTSFFRPSAGTPCSWSARSISNNAVINFGNVTVGSGGILTILQAPILSGNGTRLVVVCP